MLTHADIMPLKLGARNLFCKRQPRPKESRPFCVRQFVGRWQNTIPRKGEYASRLTAVSSARLHRKTVRRHNDETRNDVGAIWIAPQIGAQSSLRPSQPRNTFDPLQRDR